MMNRITFFLYVSFFMSSSLLIGMEDAGNSPLAYGALQDSSRETQQEDGQSIPEHTLTVLPSPRVHQLEAPLVPLAADGDDRVVVAVVAPPELIQERRCALGSLCSFLAGEGMLGLVIGASLPLVHYESEHQLYNYFLGDDIMSLVYLPTSMSFMYLITVARWLSMHRPLATANNALTASAVFGAASGLAAQASEMMVSKLMDCPLSLGAFNESSPLFEQCQPLAHAIMYTGMGTIIAVMGSVTVIMCNITSRPIRERTPLIKNILLKIAVAVGCTSLVSSFINNSFL